MPIRDRAGRFKAPIRCLRGAISFQSKANELPQSTRQVLINIHAFAFKSRPIYRSFPSICETWKIHAELLFEGGPHGEEYYGGYYGGVGGVPKCLESDKLHIQCKHAAAPPCAVSGDEAELQPAPKSQYWTCVGGQIPHYCHCHLLPDLLLYLNIKYLAKPSTLHHNRPWIPFHPPFFFPKRLQTSQIHPHVWIDPSGLAATNHRSVCQMLCVCRGGNALDPCRDNAIIARWAPSTCRQKCSERLIAFHAAKWRLIGRTV